ncbi:hypothetical protein [Synechococcus virus S-ESS1]|uniref:Uncharacterized protein n=1 Tax=Synechococcus virus S-ESS1 TaxID=1964565 RepID=A0A1V0DX54_9CAUD|nr:deoxyribonucleoside 5' monophosphate phosphatase [Synechococcus virus S-ESS1]ARB05739.1 hypothetical protein [Synechococcus virus S-ESS1]
MYYPIHIGSKVIDMMNPHPDELDIPAIEERLKKIVRFSDHPKALTVWQHTRLTERLVELDYTYSFDASSEHLFEQVRRWAKHHDDHEGVIGDIVYPVKRLISDRTNVLEIVEVRLDIAICQARGFDYPTEQVRGLTHRYDMAAQTLEWLFAMERPPEPWNPACPPHIMAQGPELVKWARGL